MENRIETNTVKIPLKTKIGYGFGSWGDVIAFNFFYVYFIYYLTDFAGLTPAMAGIISMLTIWFDAFTDPIIGGMSDRCKSPKGRRSPYMLAGIIPLYITLVLMYFVIPVDSITVKFVYYTIIGCLFWLSYTMFVIPFLSVGAELTQDYQERNSLRSWVSIFIYTGTWCGTAGPMVVLSAVMSMGITEKYAWTIGALIFGLVALVGGLISIRAIRGKQLTFEDKAEFAEKVSIGQIFKEYFSMLKLRAFRYYVGLVFCFCIAYAIEQSAVVYFMTNNLGVSESWQSLYWTFFAVFSIVQLPLVNWLCNKLGKREGSIIMYSIAAVGMAFFYFTGIESYMMLIVYCFLFNLANTVYWTIGYSMMYDTSEVLEYETGSRGEGKITGMGSFVQKVSCAIGAWMLGMLLTYFNYDASLTEQTAYTQQGILSLTTLIPAICLILVILVVLFNPLSRKKYDILLTQLEKKRKGEPSSTEGIENLF